MRSLSAVRRQLAEAYTAAMEALDQAEAEGSPTGEKTDPLPLLIPLAKTGEPLGVSRTTAFALADSGVLPTVGLPGVTGRFVRREDLEAFVAGLRSAEKGRNLRVAT